MTRYPPEISYHNPVITAPIIPGLPPPASRTTPGPPISAPILALCHPPPQDSSLLHHYQQRQEFIGDARTWEDLDTPIWKKEEGEEEEWDAVEAYFAYLYCPLAGR
ncbi:hypothetical protein EV426DRAFT_704388 [Tirmania nivea]|nr:hypothetical protein EV426DRAFT_704388 [Tirmania nivea]